MFNMPETDGIHAEIQENILFNSENNITPKMQMIIFQGFSCIN